jgi:DNA/RNA endonuclease G (NUC1)
MADIFLSYTHIDRARARPIVELLESEGWTVWWDRGIEPGMAWQPELEVELANCRAIVVLWSKTSVESQWVRHEAQAGLAKGALVPLLLDANQFPADFAHVQATDLSHWKGETHLSEIEALLRRLASLVPPSRIDTVRPGYDPNFLTAKRPVDLPGVNGAAAVLRYLHFTVVMNPARRLAHYVAYNSDGSQFVEVPRGDDWSPDPLLPESLQMNLPLLRQSSYDRGHLMARSTACWGESRGASISSRQAFYWPNVAPQHQRLNRYWWLGLEEWERSLARTREQLIGFSGPVFTDDDEPFRGEVEFEHGLVAYDTFRVPRAYWKLVVVRAPRGKLATAAYLMDQVAMLAQGVSNKIDLANYRIALADLEETARLRFPKSLHDAAAL